MKLLTTLLFLMGASACAGPVKTTWEDHYVTSKWRGGSIEYERESSKSARQYAQNKAMRDARKWCGDGREPVLKTWTPIRRLVRKVGFFLGPYLENAWHERFSFVCPDVAPVENIYIVEAKDALQCQPMTGPFRPNRERYDVMKSRVANGVCSTEGWLRVGTPEGMKHLFVGSEGLSTCKEAVSEANEANIADDQVEKWLQNRLIACDPQATAARKD